MSNEQKKQKFEKQTIVSVDRRSLRKIGRKLQKNITSICNFFNLAVFLKIPKKNKLQTTHSSNRFHHSMRAALRHGPNGSIKRYLVSNRDIEGMFAAFSWALECLWRAEKSKENAEFSEFWWCSSLEGLLIFRMCLNQANSILKPHVLMWEMAFLHVRLMFPWSLKLWSITNTINYEWKSSDSSFRINSTIPIVFALGVNGNFSEMEEKSKPPHSSDHVFYFKWLVIGSTASSICRQQSSFASAPIFLNNFHSEDSPTAMEKFFLQKTARIHLVIVIFKLQNEIVSVLKMRLIASCAHVYVYFTWMNRQLSQLR